ncbi:MAG: hypothetical protein KGK07_15165 [Chloroflexota bacterium]|nr:hypothetical protein [Chloroflexota bacterium]
MRHLTPKTLTQLRREGDVWECPDCGADNVYSIVYVEQVLRGRGLATLLKKNRVEAVEDLPVVTGSSFETCCGACRNCFAPRRVGRRRNPILHPAYTHEED